MPVFQLDDTLWFPETHLAEPEGILALGGDLSPERLLLAYGMGIFPWFSADEPILWWSPDPRFVLYPTQIHIGKNMRSVLKKSIFEFRSNTNFEAVIQHCASIQRKGQSDTWITEAMQKAYLQLHQLGYAHSFEAYQNHRLVGGFYGVGLGNVFFGESMFSSVTNASKACFSYFVPLLAAQGLQLIDCQQHSTYLEDLGAEMIARSDFEACLQAERKKTNVFQPFPFDLS